MFKKLVRKFHASVFVILESFAGESLMPNIARFLDFSHFYCNKGMGGGEALVALVSRSRFCYDVYV